MDFEILICFYYFYISLNIFFQVSFQNERPTCADQTAVAGKLWLEWQRVEGGREGGRLRGCQRLTHPRLLFLFLRQNMPYIFLSLSLGALLSFLFVKVWKGSRLDKSGWLLEAWRVGGQTTLADTSRQESCYSVNTLRGCQCTPA